MRNFIAYIKTKTQDFRRSHRILFSVVLGFCVLIVAAIICIRFFIDEPLRQTVERNVNKSLKGYTARIAKLHFQPIGLSVDLVDATIIQDEHPDPPVLHIPLLHASVHWGALLHGRLVGDFLLDKPQLRLDLRQAKKEVADKTPVTDRGWQDALQKVYPLKINVFRINGADITYVDQGPFKPLHLSNVNFEAFDIRNVRSKKADYPSEVHLDGNVFDTGKVVLDGHADFLAKPYPGIKTNFTLQQVELDYFKPIIQRYHFDVRGGVLSSDGTLEYAPDIGMAYLKNVTVDKVQIDYVHQAATAKAEDEVGGQVVKKAKELHNRPDVLVRVDQFDVKNGQLAYTNKATTPEYRLFFSDVDLRVTNLSNQNSEGTSTGRFRGKFMGDGPTLINLAWRPAGNGSDFNFDLRIENTDMTKLNQLVKAYGNFDVTAGTFAMYSEVSVNNGEINGYIKPFFKDVKIYDPQQEANKPFLHKVKEGLIATLAWVVTNKPKQDIATTIDLRGKLGSPEYSSWQAFGGMLRNAFIQALRPGLENKTPVTREPPKEEPKAPSSPVAANSRKAA